MVAPHAVALILGLGGEVKTLRDLDGVVARGLSKQSVTRVIARVASDARSARVIRDSMVSSATWKRTKGRLSVAASERTERLARVMAVAEYVWDDVERAKLWMNHPHAELHGKTPLEAARTELGARAVEDVLDRLFYGLPV